MPSELREKAVAVKEAQTTYPIHELLRTRWSPRAFADRPVEAEKLQSVLEAARWAPSSSNLQPWSFLIARKEQDASSFERMVNCLAEGNLSWAPQAPVLGIAVANPFRKPEMRNRHAWHDVGMALQSLAIQATALDLFLHMMGGFSADKARELFAIPAEFEAVTMFALGYLGDPATLPDRHREGELTARTRRPLTDFVFGDQWGVTSTLLTAEG